MTIDLDRLKEIAEMVFDDPDEMGRAMNDLAMAIVEIRVSMSTRSIAPQRSGTAPSTRMPGRPIPAGSETKTCSRCHEGVVVFIGKKSGKPYLCDAEMGEYKNIRQLLTAPNWFHSCGGGR